jgi:membrane associated rhomboid family serine protease
MNIIDELKKNFKKGNYLIKLIYANVGIFIVMQLLNLVYWISNKGSGSLDPLFNTILAYPSNFAVLVIKPWTLITYMFIHADIWHLLFNMLWLYWFGQIFLQYLDQKRMLSVYLLGGFAGALLYSILYNIFPAFELERFGSTMVGASAAIMAVVFAISAIVPNYSINILFFGPVKLKYIALFTLLIDLISIQYSNAGGHIAHIGGALFGLLYAKRHLKGKDFTSGFGNFVDKVLSIFKPRKRMKVTYKTPANDLDYNKMKVDNQKEIDRILDKIAKGGYNSLSKEEKDFLFKSSK